MVVQGLIVGVFCWNALPPVQRGPACGQRLTPVCCSSAPGSGQSQIQPASTSSRAPAAIDQMTGKMDTLSFLYKHFKMMIHKHITSA